MAVKSGVGAKKRVIFKTASGKYIARASSGAIIYNPKAKYHKSPGGTERAKK